jgi:hypothetical protein
LGGGVHLSFSDIVENAVGLHPRRFAFIKLDYGDEKTDYSDSEYHGYQKSITVIEREAWKGGIWKQ